jgi:NIMA (never in mitosis gene a)-related kinase 1/4/5
MSKLGEGSYSTVYKVQRRSDGKLYALKKVKMAQLSTR